MFKKIIIFLFLFTFHLALFPKLTLAAGEFSSSYNVSYDVDESGVTTVTEGITFKNLTDRYYASNFSLLISSSQIYDIEARDSAGPMQISTQSQGGKTKIDVKFNQQIVGVDKEYLWSLSFKSTDFATQQGKVWQVTVPKVASSEDVEKYSLTLSVPVTWGDPTTILPEPRSQHESGGKLSLVYDKQQLISSGIIANFGDEQIMDYKISYELENKSIFPSIEQIFLPSNTDYQEVLIKNVNPRPDNIVVDNDGNYVAFFKLERKKKLLVIIEGRAKLYLNKLRKSPLLDPQKQLYTSSDKYWEKDNPLIKSRVLESFKNKSPQSNFEKAKLIQDYVASNLQFDSQKLNDQNFDRLGALTVLNNPDKSLDAEYVDLFVAMARSADIPTRAKIGVGYSSNKDLRPSSFGSSVTHGWVEYYDPNLGWIMVDPSWQSTSGGVDYFTKFDLNHLSIATLGQSSEMTNFPRDIQIQFNPEEFNPQSFLTIQIISPDQLFAGFPDKLKVIVQNNSVFIHPATNFQISGAKLDLSPVVSQTGVQNNYPIPALPPFGKAEYEFNLRTSDLWESFDDVIQVKIDNQTVDKLIKVKPFFAYRLFTYSVFGVLTIMFVLYITLLIIHAKGGHIPKLPQPSIEKAKKKFKLPKKKSKSS